MPVSATKIVLKEYQNNPVDWSANSLEIIGTVGADVITDKVFVLNFPLRSIQLGNEMPVGLSADVEMAEFYFSRKSILFPASIKGQKTTFYYDSGSSAYELMTDKETCESLKTDTGSFRKEEIRSWDRMLTAYNHKTNEKIEIGRQSLLLQEATYVEGVSEKQFQQMKQLGIGGLIGNKLFLNSILLIDTQKKNFGIKKIR